jgi:hypothetical protein
MIFPVMLIFSNQTKVMFYSPALNPPLAKNKQNFIQADYSGETENFLWCC